MIILVIKTDRIIIKTVLDNCEKNQSSKGDGFLLVFVFPCGIRIGD